MLESALGPPVALTVPRIERMAITFRASIVLATAFELSAVSCGDHDAVEDRTIVDAGSGQAGAGGVGRIDGQGGGAGDGATAGQGGIGGQDGACAEGGAARDSSAQDVDTGGDAPATPCFATAVCPLAPLTTCIKEYGFCPDATSRQLDCTRIATNRAIFCRCLRGSGGHIVWRCWETCEPPPTPEPPTTGGGGSGGGGTAGAGGASQAPP
jgi:hypothetical protein